MIKYSLVARIAIETINNYSFNKEREMLEIFSKYKKNKIILTNDERKLYLTQTEKQKEMIDRAKKRKNTF